MPIEFPEYEDKINLPWTPRQFLKLLSESVYSQREIEHIEEVNQ